MFTVSRADEVVRQAGRGVPHAARHARGVGVESFHGLVAGGRRGWFRLALYVVDGVLLRFLPIGFTFSFGRFGRSGGTLRGVVAHGVAVPADFISCTIIVVVVVVLVASGTLAIFLRPQNLFCGLALAVSVASLALFVPGFAPLLAACVGGGAGDGVNHDGGIVWHQVILIQLMHGLVMYGCLTTQA